jgi:hypothetical protein
LQQKNAVEYDRMARERKRADKKKTISWWVQHGAYTKAGGNTEIETFYCPLKITAIVRHRFELRAYVTWDSAGQQTFH